MPNPLQQTLCHIIVIDNYDSFTYNLVQAIGQLTPSTSIRVFRNDRITADELEAIRPTHIILSPGPGAPCNAGNSNAIIRAWAGRVAILGVCLGHQCIGEVYGGRVVRAPQCMHGKTSSIRHDGKTIFQGLPNPLIAMRYHSLIVDPAGLDRSFTISATTEDGLVMALRNEALRIESVQFHPESFATADGQALLKNFLEAR